MVSYSPSPYRAPTLARAYRGPNLAQTFDTLLGWPPCMGDILRLTFHTGATILGIHVGLKEKGALSALGWAIGVGQGIAGLLDLVSLYTRAAGTHPPE